MGRDVGELSGIDAIGTAAFINGRNLDADRDRIARACERGNSSVFGTGINTGFAQLLAIVTAGICDPVDRITITESFDTTLYESPATEEPAGFGRPVNDPELPALARSPTGPAA